MMSSKLPVSRSRALFHRLTRSAHSSVRVIDVDVQVAGPALALFFAALGARGDPPSISSPDGSFVLSASNCPPSFENAFRLWQACVRPIKKLPSEARHDLSRLLCDKPAASSPLRIDVARLSGDLKGIALEILQVRLLYYPSSIDTTG